MSGMFTDVLYVNFACVNNKKYIFFEVLIPLCLAGLLYLLFRPIDTVIYKIVVLIGGDTIIHSLRQSINISSFPEWFVYSLPGGLWLLAFQNTITWIKRFEGRWLIPSVLLASCLGIGLEILQSLHLTDGVFDWVDVLFYSLATLLSLSNVWLVKWKWEFYASNESSPKLLGLAFVAFAVVIYLADIV
tara:strand:+ start:246 stop:809 length:564 start_codon:yes stop_codon:yes gene_type:complete